MTRVKICGINSPEALAAAAEADWVGFNFFPRSPRYVAPADVAALSGRPTRVGLFVEPTDEELDATLAVAGLQIVQVYTDVVRAAAIRQRVGIPVWRAVGIASSADLPVDAGGVDGFIIETKAPPGAALPGGNAAVFDWSALDGWSAPAPWLLAGGLTVRNLPEAVAATSAPAVDVSSGVERARGVKDPDMIREFIAAARALTVS